MIAVIYSILWILFAWRLVDWHQWRKYYPTVLFSIVGDLLYEVICYDYQLWALEANGLPNKTLAILLLSLVGMPASVFIYLSTFPKTGSLIRKALHILLFTLIFAILEWISIRYGAITYHHGWNLYWSISFDVAMFIILRIHYRNPLFAWMLSAGFILLLSSLFQLTLDKMK